MDADSMIIPQRKIRGDVCIVLSRRKNTPATRSESMPYESVFAGVSILCSTTISASEPPFPYSQTRR